MAYLREWRAVMLPALAGWVVSWLVLSIVPNLRRVGAPDRGDYRAGAPPGVVSGRQERLIAASYAGLHTVCGVGRRNGLSTQQLFTWRREAKKCGTVRLKFAQVMLAAPLAAALDLGEKREVRRRTSKPMDSAAAPIVVEARAVLVRIVGAPSPRAVEAFLRALKGGS